MLIYCCLNRVNGKVYVGKTSASLRRRWSEHKSAARRGSPYLFHRALRKYGDDAFEISVLATTDSEVELNRLELHDIQEMGAQVPGGYNLREGGEGGAHSAATRQRLREQALGRKWDTESIERLRRSMMGEGNPFFGRSHTEETRAMLREKCADVTRGIPKTLEHREKIRQGLLQHERTPEHCAAISEGLRGRVLTAEHREHISRGVRGIPKPEGFAAKVSAAQKGRPKSEETKQKLRDAALRRYRGETP